MKNFRPLPAQSRRLSARFPPGKFRRTGESREKRDSQTARGRWFAFSIPARFRKAFHGTAFLPWESPRVSRVSRFRGMDSTNSALSFSRRELLSRATDQLT
jgi:hypothetical protein